MKKILVLTLVLGMVSLANATLTITVDGQDVGDEITIKPSDDIMIGVYSDVDGVGYDAYAAIIIDAAAGKLGSWVGDPIVYDLTPGDPIAEFTYYGEALAGFDTYLLNNSTLDVENQPSAGLAFEIKFHCDAEGDVVIKLDNDAWGNTVDTLTIHQIPEPMTLALLGLGGLFLRRRK